MIEVKTEKVPTPKITLPKEFQSLSPVCQEGVKDILTRFQRMKESKRWLKIRTPEELNAIIPQIQEISQNYLDALKPFKKEDYTWRDAEVDTFIAFQDLVGEKGLDFWHIVDKMPWGLGQLDSFQIGKEIAEENGNLVRGLAKEEFTGKVREAMVGDLATEAVASADYDAGLATAWETIKDQSGFEKNPYSHLLSLREQGAVMIRFHEHDKLVVHFPLKIEGKVALGCWSFGDSEILYYHDLGYHPNIRLKQLKPSS